MTYDKGLILDVLIPECYEVRLRCDVLQAFFARITFGLVCSGTLSFFADLLFIIAIRTYSVTFY